MFLEKSSLLPPVVKTTVSFPIASVTSRLCLIAAANDAVEYGITIPLVPKIEMPPKIPSLGLSVFDASSLPLGTEIITLRPFFSRRSWATFEMFSIIIFFGVGLIAAEWFAQAEHRLFAELAQGIGQAG